MKWILLLVFGFVEDSYARPEYALRNNIVNCSTCHTSPVGGGFRNRAGTFYGAHGYKLSPITEKSEWFHLDYRAEAFQAKNASTRKGLLTMTTTPAVNIPFQFDKESPPEMNFVASYGLGRLETGLGYAYVRYNLNNSNKWIEHVIFGRFNVPFGLITDEHRAFTKISVPTSTRDYEMGFLMSGTPSYTFHYDIAATSGKQGDMPAVDDSPWALYASTRYMPRLGPVMAGLSYSRHGTQTVNIQPEAYNLYAMFSIEKLTTYKLPIILIAEMQWAHGWNNDAINSQMSNFIPGSLSSYQDAIDDSRSETLLLELDWNITRKFTSLYRYEEFIPDSRYSADKFKRHSFGFKYFLNGHSSLLARFENGYSKKPGMTEDVRSVGTATYILYHLWL